MSVNPESPVPLLGEITSLSEARRTFRKLTENEPLASVAKKLGVSPTFVHYMRRSKKPKSCGGFVAMQIQHWYGIPAHVWDRKKRSAA